MTMPYNESERPVTVEEAGKLFPRPISAWAVRKRIKDGIDGVRLAADFDGYRYWVYPSEIRKFLDEVTARRRARTAYLSQQFRTLKERAAAARAEYMKL